MYAGFETATIETADRTVVVELRADNGLTLNYKFASAEDEKYCAFLKGFDKVINRAMDSDDGKFEYNGIRATLA
ncbi:MAG: hypothetical protein ABGX82_14700 [Pseudomonas sp.]|uniref:hypothetical protein n=1 Tax=Pseudomonas sp. TaxID=306 RepID=UPI003242A0F5